MLKLIEPNISHKDQWEEIMKEWKNKESSLNPGALFLGENYNEFLYSIENNHKGITPNRVPGTLFFLINENQRILGAVEIRHHIDHPDVKEVGGHIGYGIRPSERRKGYAKEMLKHALIEARKFGIYDVLITCSDDNIASYKTIEANGGIFERYAEKDGVKKRRYWISLYKQEKEPLSLELIEPNISHKDQWEEIMKEWDKGRKAPRVFFQDTFGQFLDIISGVRDGDDLIHSMPKSSCYFLWDNEKEKIIGFYTFRHNLNFWDDATNGGNIGYGIRPSERNKGYGKEGLRLVLDEVKKLGFLDIFIACDDDNEGSIKIIETNGGILEKSTIRNGVPGRRYWIDLYKQEKEFLTSLELELHTSECRQNPERIDELLADDFFECGKFGDRFGKKECLEWLPAETDKKITACDISVHILSPNIGQVRYMSQIGGDGDEVTTSFRSSLWRKTESGWQMFFHQGTLLQFHK